MQEWFTRDRVTQSVVYQISRLADELRILKEIVRIQRDIVSQVMRRLSDGMPVPRYPLDVGDQTNRPQHTDKTTAQTQMSPAWGSSPTFDQTDHISNASQRKTPVKHENFLADLERLEDTIERSKRQVRRKVL